MKKIIVAALVLTVGLFVTSRIKAQEVFSIVGSLPVGQVGVAYPPTLMAIGGVGPFNCTAQDPGLPAGLSIDSTSTLHGTPQVAFSNYLTFTCMSSDGGGETAGLLLVINPASQIVSTGKKTADIGKITAMGTNTLTVGKVLVRLTPNTVVIKLGKVKTITVGLYAAYAGVINTDGSVTAAGVIIQ
jgi:hypothetical protein